MTQELIILCAAAFVAGFIDAISGGGGLVQTPAMLVTLPQYPLATLLGTIKIPSFSGTAMAIFQYARKVRLYWRLLIFMGIVAGSMAFAGSTLLTQVSSGFMKPAILLVLVATAVYTFLKKDLGTANNTNATVRPPLWKPLLIAAVIGFYDGFIGPGAGSFLILAFVSVMGFDFLRASAHAKLVNLATNLGSITFFISTGRILFKYALPMAVCNALGAMAGARLAILKGNRFIRIFFLLVICVTIARLAWDVVREW